MGARLETRGEFQSPLRTVAGPFGYGKRFDNLLIKHGLRPFGNEWQAAALLLVGELHDQSFGTVLATCAGGENCKNQVCDGHDFAALFSHGGHLYFGHVPW